jgi:hypothetical protein
MPESLLFAMLDGWPALFAKSVLWSELSHRHRVNHKHLFNLPQPGMLAAGGLITMRIPKRYLLKVSGTFEVTVQEVFRDSIGGERSAQEETERTTDNQGPKEDNFSLADRNRDRSENWPSGEHLLVEDFELAGDGASHAEAEVDPTRLDALLAATEEMFQINQHARPPREGSTNSAVWKLAQQLPAAFSRKQFESVVPVAMRYDPNTRQFGITTKFSFYGITRACQQYFSEFKKREWIVPIP